MAIAASVREWVAAMNHQPASLFALAGAKVSHVEAPEYLQAEVDLAHHKAKFTACMKQLRQLTYHGFDLSLALRLIESHHDPIESKGWDEHECNPDDVPWTLEDYVVMNYQSLKQQTLAEREEHIDFVWRKALNFSSYGGFTRHFLKTVASEAAISRAFCDGDTTDVNVVTADVDVVLALARIPLYLHRDVGI